MNRRINPQATTQSVQIQLIEEIFNRFRSGAETLSGALGMTDGEYELLLHGEASLSLEQIDRLCELGFSLESLFDVDKKVL